VRSVFALRSDVFRNNIITNSSYVGIYSDFAVADYNCFWNNNANLGSGLADIAINNLSLIRSLLTLPRRTIGFGMRVSVSTTVIRVRNSTTPTAVGTT